MKAVCLHVWGMCVLMCAVSNSEREGRKEEKEGRQSKSELGDITLPFALCVCPYLHCDLCLGFDFAHTCRKGCHRYYLQKDPIRPTTNVAEGKVNVLAAILPKHRNHFHRTTQPELKVEEPPSLSQF